MIDQILENGCIHTLDPECPIVRTVAVARGRIVAVGARAATLAQRVPAAARCDLDGCCVLPGLVDSHLHFATYAQKLAELDPETDSLEEVARRVRQRAAVQPPGSWIVGFGWNHHRWGGTFPERSVLDRAAPDHPVFLRAKSGHAGWANSMAMRLAGVDAGTAAPASGRILRDDRGLPTGIFLEGAQELIDRAIPGASLEDVAAAMEAAQQQALAHGLTGVHDLDGAQAFQAWQLLRARGRMRLRVWQSIPGASLEHALELGLRAGLGDAWLRVGGAKFFADGALGPRTAWMLAPYEGDSGNAGMPLMDPGELRERLLQAAASGWAVLVHAIGDRANREVLDVLAVARQREAGADAPLRHRIEHAQCLALADLDRFAPLHVIASMQPLHATSDMDMVERHWGARRTGAYAFRSLLDRGVRLAFGSDAPVETIAPLAGIHAAVTRRRADGTPGESGWCPDQRLTVAEAVRAYTLGAAYAAGEEQDKGSLRVGKVADLVVLDRDIFGIPAMEILQARVLGTMVDGVWQHRAGGFAAPPATG